MPLLKFKDNNSILIDIEAISTMSRDELENYARKLHQALAILESDYKAGIVFSLKNGTRYIYKKRRFKIKSNSEEVETSFLGKFREAELMGIYAERERRRQISRKNGKRGAADKHPEHEKAKSLIADEFNARKHTFENKKIRAEFVAEMKEKNQIFKDEKNIENFIRELENAQRILKP